MRVHRRRHRLQLLATAAVATATGGGGQAALASAAGLTAETCHEQGGKEYCPADGLCHPDGNCAGCDGYLVEDTDSHECIDRTIFASHVAFDFIAVVIWFCGAGLAVSAGVGGGGIFVPLGILLLRFASKAATGLSQASIFGASFAGLLLNARARHPKADRPLIDFDMALFLSPMEMAGALLGVLVQKMLPNWAVIVLMAVILGFTAYKTFIKGCATLKKERAANAASKAKASKEAAVHPPIHSHPLTEGVQPPKEPVMAWGPVSSDGAGEGIAVCGSPSGSTKSIRSAASAVGPTLSLPTSEAWLAQDALMPWRKCAYLAVMWVTLLVLLVLKGGKGTKGVVPYCSAGYWVVTAVSFLFLLLFSLAMGYNAVRDSIQKAAVSYPFCEGDIVWTWRKFFLYCMITFFAGVIAGLIGIGGGMVLGPMMLQLGVLPQVSSATTATMIVLTSSSAALVFITSGVVPMSYAATLFCVAFTGALTGKIYIDRLVKRLKLTAIIVLLLASIIAFASAMMTVNGVIIYSARDWEFDTFTSVC